MKSNHSNSAAFDAVFVKLLSKLAPILILLGMCLSFLFLGIVQCQYYSKYLLSNYFESFSTVLSLSIILAIIFQLVRFAFGISSADEFAEGNWGKGTIGLIFSIGLTAFEWFEIYEITHYWVNSTGVSFEGLFMVLQCVSIVALALELRLIVNISKSGNYSFRGKSVFGKNSSRTVARQAKEAQSANYESSHTGNRKRRDKQKNFAKVQKAFADFIADHNRKPSIVEVAKKTGLNRKTVSNYYTQITN